MRKFIPILLISLVSVLLVSGCIGQQTSESTQNTTQSENNKNTTNPQSQYYDNLDNSLQEIDALQQAEGG